MKSVAVLGAGESGVGAALLAQKEGLKVFVSDFGEIPEKYKEELIKNKIPFEEKGHSFEKLEKANVIIKSPGIPEDADVIQHFRLRQTKIISEIEWASRFFKGKIIGVTGSNGKTTTASLIYHLIRDEEYNVGLTGNIGTSMARILCSDTNYNWLVVELSSFQLDDIYEFEVDVGIILNISPDHLDRYDYDINKYADSKWRLAKAIKPGGHLILNKEDQMINERLQYFKAEVNIHRLSADFPMTSLSSKDDNVSFEIKLKGRHNLFNAAIAIKVSQLLGIPDSRISERIASFTAIPHRLEPVGVINNVEYINDSKATNVDSAIFALEAMEHPVIWIAGGTDKGNNYEDLIPEVRSKVKILICLCRNDSKLKSTFHDFVGTIYSTKDMKDAVNFAYQNAMPGDVVLLSPACASFDLFDNYIHRGEEFKKVVLNFLSESIN